MTHEQQQLLNVMALNQAKLDCYDESLLEPECSSKTFAQLAAKAEVYFGGNVSLEDVLSEEELKVYQSNTGYNDSYRLSETEIKKVLELGMNLGWVCMTKNIAAFNYKEALHMVKGISERICWNVTQKAEESNRKFYEELMERIKAIERNVTSEEIVWKDN